MKETLSTFIDTLANNALYKGGIPTGVGAGISFIEQVEQWMRLTSLGIGIFIGLLVLYSKIRSMLKQGK